MHKDLQVSVPPGPSRGMGMGMGMGVGMGMGMPWRYEGGLGGSGLTIHHATFPRCIPSGGGGAGGGKAAFGRRGERTDVLRVLRLAFAVFCCLCICRKLKLEGVGMRVLPALPVGPQQWIRRNGFLLLLLP